MVISYSQSGRFSHSYRDIHVASSPARGLVRDWQDSERPTVLPEVTLPTNKWEVRYQVWVKFTNRILVLFAAWYSALRELSRWRGQM
jgi:hypothetical protein